MSFASLFPRRLDPIDRHDGNRHGGSLRLTVLLLCLVTLCGSWIASAAPKSADSAWLTLELRWVAERLDRALVAANDPSGTDSEQVRAEADSLARDLDHLAEQAARRGETLGDLLPGKLGQLRLLIDELQSYEPGQVLPGSWPVGARGGHPATPGWLGGGPANDQCSAATLIQFGDIASGSTAGADQDGQATCGASLFTADVWYRFTTQASGQVFAETFGADYDSVLSVHTACPGTTGNELACNDDHFGLQAGMSFPVQIGHEYWIRVSGANGASGSFQLGLGSGGVIEGRVSDAAGDSLPEGAAVRAFSDGTFSRGTLTAADGSYSLGGLPPGNYVVRAYAGDINLIAELWDDVHCPNTGFPWCDQDQGTVIEIDISSHVENIDFMLETGGSVSGTVTDTASMPLAFATVDLWTAAGGTLGRTFADADGRWSVDGLSGGGYFVLASETAYRSELFDKVPCPGGVAHGCELSDGTLVMVTLGENTLGIDFELTKEASISGTITEIGTGQPLSSVHLALTTEFGTYVGFGTTDSQGRYEIGGLEPGQYLLATDGTHILNQLWDGVECPGRAFTCPMEDGSPIEVLADTETAGIDFALYVLPSISGRVTSESSGLPLESILVRAFQDGQSFSSGTGFTNSNGEYSIDRLQPGSYRVAARGEGEFVSELYFDLPCLGGPSICALQAGILVPIEAGASASGIDFTLADGAEISGSVTELPDGTSLSGVFVQLFDAAGNFVDADTTVDGEYRLAGLDAGTYFARMRPPSHEYQLFDGLPCDQLCDPTVGTPITLAPAEVRTGVDFALQRRGSMAGMVTDAESSTPVVGARVDLYDHQGSFWDSISTLADGSFRFENLRSGTYFAVVRDASYLDELWQDLPCESSCEPTSGAAIEVLPDQETTGIDFEIDRSGSISGRLTDQLTGLAVSGFEVSLYRLPGNSVGTRKSDSEGEYSFSDLESGTYFILASEEFSAPFINYSSVIYKGLVCRRLSSMGCDPFQGTPIMMTVPTDIVGIDVALPPRGSVAGRVTDAATGAPLDQVQVRVFVGDESVGSGYTESDGSYLVNSVDLGAYSLITENSQGYLDELYDDIPCFGGLPGGCNPALGTPVTVDMGSTTRHVDFGLQFFDGGLAGWVTEESSGEALTGVLLDVWDEMGEHVATTSSDLTGRYRLTLEAGTYYVTTDNGDAFIDEVFDDVPCAGPALAGLCDPTLGSGVEVLDDGIGPLLVDDINFALAPAGIFSSGFESGGTADWDATVP